MSRPDYGLDAPPVIRNLALHCQVRSAKYEVECSGKSRK